MSDPADLQEIVAEALANYRDLLDTYGSTADAFIGSWTSNEWNVSATDQVASAIRATASTAGTALGLTRRFLATAAELGGANP